MNKTTEHHGIERDEPDEEMQAIGFPHLLIRLPFLEDLPRSSKEPATESLARKKDLIAKDKKLPVTHES